MYNSEPPKSEFYNYKYSSEDIPLRTTVFRIFFLEGRSRGWDWLVCFTTGRSGPCWTSAPALSAWTWKEGYIRSDISSE